MHEPYSARRDGHIRRTVSCDRPVGLPVRGVDDHVRPDRPDHSLDRLAIPDIQLDPALHRHAVVGRDDLTLGLPHELAPEQT